MADIDSPGPVADALGGLYKALHQAAELAIRQKVRFKVRFHYCGLYRLFLCILGHPHEHDHEPKHGHHGHCERHHPEGLHCLLVRVLCRIEHMGADADSTLDPVTPTDDVKPAIEAMIAALETAYSAGDAAADAAMEAKDRPAFALASEAVQALDGHVGRLRAELLKIQDMGAAYLVTVA